MKRTKLTFAGVVVATLVVAGCTDSKVDGSAKPAPKSPAESSATSPQKPSPTTSAPAAAAADTGVNADVLPSLMLSVDELNAAMGDHAMKVTYRGTKLLDTTADRSYPGTKPVNDCGIAPIAGLREDGYEGAGYLAVDHQIAEDDRGGRVTQVLTSFADSRFAKDFFDSQSKLWVNCAGGTGDIRLTDPGEEPVSWYMNPAERELPGVLSVSLHTSGPPGSGTFNCQHSFTVRRNVGIDVQACGYYSEAREAPALAVKIADRVPAE